MDKLIFWELNEINFEYVNYYIKQGKLKNWKKFIEAHGLFTTLSSEKKYEELEPWIQWTTIRTGLDYAEHQVFRLGDMEHKAIKQHWEILEDHGYSVAALSPINGANHTKHSPFWLSDPWVDTKTSGDEFAQRITQAIKQAINDNSEEKLDISTIVVLIEGLLTKTQFSSWNQYLSGIFGALKKQHWSKAIVLDRLLVDIFLYFWKKHQPDFAVLFLNSGAHIQHHYMCSSPAYNGNKKNPSWYIDDKQDPLLEILELYDNILAEFQKIKGIRLMISVGLRQIPYENPTFYWRLVQHEDFLRKIGIPHKNVSPRMTRDFLIRFNNKDELNNAVNILSKTVSSSGVRIFEEIDNRGEDLFVTLTFPSDINDNFSLFIEGKEYKGFKGDVVFVAIKNGKHDALGYYLDNKRIPNELESEIPLKKLFNFIMQHFNIHNNNCDKGNHYLETE